MGEDNNIIIAKDLSNVLETNVQVKITIPSEIEAQNASMENKYIQSATLNGEKLDKPWVAHDAIINGGRLVFEMGPKANKSWGVSK